jgi:hypothetical protein
MVTVRGNGDEWRSVGGNGVESWVSDDEPASKSARRVHWLSVLLYSRRLLDVYDEAFSQPHKKVSFTPAVHPSLK